METLIERICVFIDDNDYSGSISFLNAIRDKNVRREVCYNALFYDGLRRAPQGFRPSRNGKYLSEDGVIRAIDFVLEDNLLKTYWGDLEASC